MMKLLCLALVLLINWTQAIPPDELAAYIHFFDTEDDMMSDDFKTEDIMHPALVGEGLANPPEIPITSAKNNVYFDQWLFPEPKVDSYEAKNPLLTTNKASSHKEIDVTVEKDSSNEILSTPDATSTLSGGKTKHHFLNKNKISFTDVREQDGLAQPFNLSDFFNQLVKLCIESIGLVMDSFMGAIKTTSTEKSPGDSIYDDFYDLRSATTKSKIIKKRDASEREQAFRGETLSWMDSILLTVAAVLLLSLDHSAGSPLPNDIHNFVPLRETSPAELPALSEPSDSELEELESLLTTLLVEDPWRTVGDPLVYITEPAADHQELQQGSAVKRSRYYRRYPWKRQNGRNYDPDGYMCTPSKDDVFQLLVALHEARGGKERTVHFCNRRRPARAIFTNIRFLGR